MRISDWSSDVCSSDLLEWVEAMGTGTVYSVTVIGRKPPAAPYHVALIDLDEGPRLMSRVEGMAAEDVRIGMKVKASAAQEDETPILVFDPVCGGFAWRHLSTRSGRDHGPRDLRSRHRPRPHSAGTE